MSKNQRFKRQHAVALRYAEEDRAPKVVASGAGELAKRIIALAEEFGVHVQRDDSLAEVLAQVDIGQDIPPETYKVVAEILAFLIKSDLVWSEKQKKAELARLSQR